MLSRYITPGPRGDMLGVPLRWTCIHLIRSRRQVGITGVPNGLEIYPMSASIARSLVECPGTLRVLSSGESRA